MGPTFARVNYYDELRAILIASSECSRRSLNRLRSAAANREAIRGQHRSLECIKSRRTHPAILANTAIAANKADEDVSDFARKLFYAMRDTIDKLRDNSALEIVEPFLREHDEIADAARELI